MALAEKKALISNGSNSASPSAQELTIGLLQGKGKAILVGKHVSFFTHGIDETMLFVCPPEPIDDPNLLRTFEENIFKRLRTETKKNKSKLKYEESKQTVENVTIFAQISYAEPSSEGDESIKENIIMIYPSQKIAEIALAAARKEYHLIPEELSRRNNPAILIQQFTKNQLELVK